MTPARWQQLKPHFERLSELPADERQAELDAVCADDPVLRLELEVLLKASDAPDTFLEQFPERLRNALDAAGPRPDDLHAGVILCGRFRIDRLLGEGGMGSVWAAFDSQLSEEIAIKTIRTGNTGDTRGVARFKRELQLARRIGHPNICRVYELFEDLSVTPPRLFLTMELLEGETLAARLRRMRKLSPQDAMPIIRQLTAGLTAAHAAGVIHRDFKPANVMLVPAPGGDRAVIMDFGLARTNQAVAGDGATQSGILIGTPEYMAPEQIAGGTVSPATDVYALGLTMYEMLRGQSAFAGKSTLESWMRRAREGPPKLSGSVVGLNPRLDRVIARCVEYEPADRFVSVDDVWAALEGTRRVAGMRRPLRLPLTRAAVGLLGLAALGGAGLAWREFRPGYKPSTEAMHWYEDAHHALEEGSETRALREFRQAVKAAPGFAAAHAGLADALMGSDLASSAHEEIERASQLAPDPNRLPAEQAQYLRGVQHLILGQCPAALESFRLRVEQMADGEKAFGLATVARAQEKCDQQGEALKTLTEAARIDPRNGAVLTRGAILAARTRDYARANDWLGRAEALYQTRGNFEGLAAALQVKGSLQAEQEQLDEAERTLEKAAGIARTIGDVRRQVTVLIAQATIARKRGNIDAATGLVESAVTLAKRNDLEVLTIEALLSSGTLMLVRHRLAEAEQYFSRAQEIAERFRVDREKARAGLSLASAYVNDAQPRLASEALQSAVPYYERTRHTRNLALAKMLRGQVLVAGAEYPAAIALFREELARIESSGDKEQGWIVKTELATALAETSDYKEAAVLFESVAMASQSTRRTSQEAYAWLNLSAVRSHTGDIAGATRAFALAQAPIGKLAASRTDVRAEAAYVSALMALRKGTPAVALDVILTTLDNSLVDGVQLRNGLLQCAALSGLRRFEEASKLGERIVRQAAERGYLQMELKGKVRLAEIYARMGRFQDVERLVSEVRPGLSRATALEDLWTVCQIRIRAGGQPGSPVPDDCRTTVSQIQDNLRLKWGEASFRVWNSRADLLALQKV